MDDDNEWKNLPVDEKCVHKSWKARLEGYEAAARLFQSIDDDKSPEWSKYAGLVKKFIADSNLTAQEKGLDAVLAYAENYVHAGKTVGEVMSNLVQKCIGSSTKAKTKELAVQICLMYIEIEKYEVVVEELLKGTESKNPKTSCGCLIILTQALKEFGPKIIPVSKILKKMMIVLSDRDKNVRGEGRALIVEIYRWIGPPIKQQLSTLKAAQLTELEAEFEKISGPPPQPKRLLRSQQAKKITERSVESGDGIEDIGVDEGDGVEEIDPTEFLEPVDVLSKLPKNFMAQLEEKKWTERRDALEILEKELQSAPRLEPVDYGDLIRALKKIVAKDSNIVVVVVALKCLTGLANGLKKKFMPYVGMLFSTLLEKFKEKKQNVLTALRDSVDAIFLVAHLESIHEDTIAALDNKNPCIKNEVSLFLARCFTRCTPTILNKKLLKALSAGLLKVLNDSDPGARDAAASALGTAMKVVGEKGIAPFLADIGDQKMSKIKSCCESATLQAPIKVAEVKTDKPSATSKQPSAKSVTRPTSKTVRPLKKDASSLKTAPKDTDLSKKLSNKIPSNILNELNDSDGNKRLQAYEELLKHIQNSEIPKESISAFFEAIGTLEDDNAGVVKVKINAMKAIAEKTDLSSMELKSTLVSLLKKYSDSKYADNVAGCFASFAKSLGNDNFAQSILAQNIVADKLLWASSLKWISEGIINYNLTFNEDYLQREAQKAIKSGNLQMKYAGCAFAGTIQMMNKDGDSAPPSSDHSPKETSPIKSEIPKKREIKSSDGISSSKASVDISAIINSQCLSELSDESWKARLDCLEKLRPLIENAGPISSNIGEVQNVFENLLTDKNTKVTQSALMCLASLVKGLGPHSRKYTGFFLAKVLKNLSDPKVWVRNCVINVLDTFGTSGGYKELFDNDTIADVCTTITLPAARVELFNWICHTLNKVESVPSDGLIAMLPILYQSLEDRNGDIRKASNETVISCMMHLGYDTMLNASSNLKGSTAVAVKNLLDKNRGSVPEPPVVEKTVRGGKSIQMKKLSPGSSATFTKPSKTVKPGPTSRSAGKKDDQENVDGPLLDRNNFKHQRVMDEQKLKTLKWNFSLPRPEFIEQLKDQMNSANMNPGLVMSMFHSDFKFHIKAIDSLTEDLPINREGMICNLDLILRWMTLRFFDTNPSVLIKGLEYLLNIFNALIDENYSMLDIEANSFLPYLLLKAGDTKDTVKNHVRNIFKLTALIYPRQKLFGIMMEGLKSKNARLRSELLELLCWMISTYSLEVCSPNVGNTLKEIGKHIGDKDTSVRNGALNCMVAVFHIVGEDIHKLIGQLPYGPSSLLEERLKRASKQRPVANIKPHNINQEEAMHHIRNRTPDEMNNSAESSNSSENNEMNATFSRDSSPLPETTQYHQSPQHQQVYHQQTQQPKEMHMGAILEQKITGPFRLDPSYYQPLPSIEFPDIKTPDLNFLNSPIRLRSKVFTLPGVSKNTSSQPTTMGLLSKHEDPIIKEFTNPDLEKAITSMAQIETLLYSNKADTIKRKMDFLASQLEQQLIILNQSTHPDLVNCYRGNFSLILKFSDNESLSQEISEPYLSKLIKQLLLLLTENRLEKIGQEMFVKTVNNVVIRLLETSNKTASVCGLIKMLQSTIRSPTSKDFHDLVTKCLWKLSRTQSVWDHQLNYPLVLSDINNFLVEFPSSYWKAQETDIALRTIKTLLHTMVKIRGARVKEELIKVPGLPRASEMSLYISKVIKHYQLENNQQSNNINNPSGSKDDNKTVPKSDFKNSVNNDPQNEILDILQPFVNSNESPDALKRLFEFKKTHPQFDIDVHLLSLPTPAICYIKRGLVNLEIKSNQCENNVNSSNDCENNVKITNNSARRVTEDPELDYLWKRLDYWTQLTKTGN